MPRLPLPWLLPLLCGVLVFGLAVERLKTVKRHHVDAEIRVALPLFVQVAMAGGDRHLAASWATVRALVTETAKMVPDEYRILATVQRDASWLNPAHEDNYYIAAAILPWENQLDAAQTVLRRATLARPFDLQPPFYYAFNLYQFRNDPQGASDWLRRFAPRLPAEDDRLLLENIAARWLDRSRDLDQAARIVEAMAAQSKRKDFADYLRQRAQRLRELIVLRRAAAAYAERNGRPPARLEDLVAAGLLQAIPVDPFGFGFDLDRNGQPVILNSPKK